MDAITPLIASVLENHESKQKGMPNIELHLFYNHPTSKKVTYAPVHQKLLPIDARWIRNLIQIKWPTKSLPDVIGSEMNTFKNLVQDYLFISLFRACAESMASENASRLAAMQRAEKNIDEMLEDLRRTYHQLRQSEIDEELFDVVSGFDAIV